MVNCCAFGTEPEGLISDPLTDCFSWRTVYPMRNFPFTCRNIYYPWIIQSRKVPALQRCFLWVISSVVLDYVLLTNGQTFSPDISVKSPVEWPCACTRMWCCKNPKTCMVCYFVIVWLIFAAFIKRTIRPVVPERPGIAPERHSLPFGMS